MGMSTAIYGKRIKDIKEYIKMKAIYDLCLESKIKIPEEVLDIVENDYEKNINLDKYITDESREMEDVKKVSVNDLIKLGIDYIYFENSY